jgi:hypothetical protein
LESKEIWRRDRRYGAYIRDETISNRKAKTIKTINKAFLAAFAFFGLVILSAVAACCVQSSTSDPAGEIGW